MQLQLSTSEGGSRHLRPLFPLPLLHGPVLLIGDASGFIFRALLAQLGLKQKSERILVGKLPFEFSLCIICSSVLDGKCDFVLLL